MISCILLAAGSARRMKAKENKVFLSLGPLSVLQWNLFHLLDVNDISQVIIVGATHEIDRLKRESHNFQNYVTHTLHRKVPYIIEYVAGGAERQDSVRAGLSKVKDTTDIVLVHDGARPVAKAKLFNDVAMSAKQYGAAVAAIPAIDTIKRVDEKGFIQETLNRNELYHMQTPQGFKKDLFKKAHQNAKTHNYIGTDDVSLIELLGAPVKVITGDYRNVKLTTPNDIPVIKSHLGIFESEENSMMRVGFGYDIHRFKKGRPCILGGVLIDSPIGPDGHSDADVLIHALMDALLGAAGLRDIGYYFPPNDETFKDISSMKLLKKVISLLKEHSFQAYNVDIMVIAEAPKLKPHIEAMKLNIHTIMNIPVDRISIKATTNEQLGAIGRHEGIAAQAVVSIYEIK